MTKLNKNRKSREEVKEAYKCLIKSFIGLIASIWVFLETVKLVITPIGEYLVGQLTEKVLVSVLVQLLVALLLRFLEGS